MKKRKIFEFLYQLLLFQSFVGFFGSIFVLLVMKFTFVHEPIGYEEIHPFHPVPPQASFLQVIQYHPIISTFCAICGIIFFLYVAYNVIKTIEMHVSGKEKDARLLMHHCINALINLKNVNIKDLKEEKAMIGEVNVYLTNPGDLNPEKVIDYYSDSDFEYNLRIGDYCKVVLDREEPTHWISGIIIEINEEENSFSIIDSDGNIIKIECDHIHNICSKEELQNLMKGKSIK